MSAAVIDLLVLAVSEGARMRSGQAKKADDRHLQPPKKDAASTLLWQIQRWKSGSRKIHYAARLRRPSSFDRPLSDFICACNEPYFWSEALRAAGRERKSYAKDTRTMQKTLVQGQPTDGNDSQLTHFLVCSWQAPRPCQESARNAPATRFDLDRILPSLRR